MVGLTCILNNFHTINDIYSFKQKITSEEIRSHLKYLIEANLDKKVIVFLDNARFHKSKVIQEFCSQEKEHLELIFLPKYSPYMNMWNYLKAKLFRHFSRKPIEDLASDVKDIFDNLNNNVDKINSLAYARKFLV